MEFMPEVAGIGRNLRISGVMYIILHRSILSVF